MIKHIWLAGSGTFGARVAEALADLPSTEIVAVTASMDDPLGRWTTSNLVRLFDAHIPPDSVHDLDVDLIVSAQNYTWISPEARAASRRGAVGYHPSLLPRHRGRAAVQWTIALGDPTAGGSVYQMDDGWDTGYVIQQEFCHVLPDWTASDLWRKKLFPIGLRLLRNVVATMGYGTILRPQDERAATLAPKWDFPASPEQVRDDVRAGEVSLDRSPYDVWKPSTMEGVSP